MDRGEREQSLAMSTERMVALFRIIGGVAGVVLTVTDVIPHPPLEHNIEIASLSFLGLLGIVTLLWLQRGEPDPATLRRYMLITFVLDSVVLLAQAPLHAFVALEAPSPALLVPLLGAVRFGYRPAVIGTIGVAGAYGLRGWLAVDRYGLEFGIDPMVVTVLLSGIIGLISAHLFTSAQRGRARADGAAERAEAATASAEALHRVLTAGVGGGVGTVIGQLAGTINDVLGASSVSIRLDEAEGNELLATAGSAVDGGAIEVHEIRYGTTRLGELVVTGSTDLDLDLDAIAVQVGLAVHAARLLDSEAGLAARYRAVDLMRSNFVSLTSHELRTPTTVIVGAVQTLSVHGDNLEPDERKSIIGMIERQAGRLTQLVEDLLTVGRTDAGAMAYEPGYVAVHDLVHAVSASLERPLAASDAPDVSVWADPTRTTHVLLNLVANAYEHGVEPVEIDWQVDDDRLCIRVTDDGPGIAPSDRERVFDRFVQLESIQHHNHGNGLGLGISRDLMRAMGGDVWIDDDAPTTSFVMGVPLGPLGTQGAQGSQGATVAP